LRDHRQYLCTAFLEHIKCALDREEPIRIGLLSDSLKEDGQVVMIVKLSYINLPVDPVVSTMLDSNRQIATVIKAAEF